MKSTPQVPGLAQLEISWKEPSQERSRQRFQGILAAAGQLLDQGGMDSFTMDNVARGAGTSMGSLYHFFPDRDALLMALTTAVHRDLYALISELAKPANVGAEPEAAIGLVFPALLKMIKKRPGTRSIFSLAHSVPAIQRARGPFAAAFAEMTEVYLMFRYPQLSPRQRQAAARLFHHLSESLIVLVSASAEKQRGALIRESEAAMVAYLRTLE